MGIWENDRVPFSCFSLSCTVSKPKWVLFSWGWWWFTVDWNALNKPDVKQFLLNFNRDIIFVTPKIMCYLKFLKLVNLKSWKLKNNITWVILVNIKKEKEGKGRPEKGWFKNYHVTTKMDLVIFSRDIKTNCSVLSQMSLISTVITIVNVISVTSVDAHFLMALILWRPFANETETWQWAKIRVSPKEAKKESKRRCK